MKIKDLFERDIYRHINGVVKADQLDESSIWQELDEFVVTRELVKHINDLVSVLLSTIESEAEAASKNGIWVSGFFGSGKSHFIKVLSYLLDNHEHHHGGDTRRAIDFFKDKLPDAMLFAELQKVVSAGTETILFNIDTKADLQSGRDALLQVFLKVLNEKEGYSSDHPHIAHMERYLDGESKLAQFHEAYQKHSGESWASERDAWEFHRDEVVAALSEMLGQSKESVEKWVDRGAENFSLTVENFAGWVREYLDKKGSDHRLMFLVDEVGQFIGNDTHLMLNLQTITEQLGTVCKGRAWVVVTSQEDLDAVLGDLKNTKQHDFSKIQGRFRTRLSFSSANVDEVIKKRILEKNEDAIAPLAAAYEGKHDILKNQLSFVKAGMTFKTFADAEDFTACYPFAAYQFSLVQKVFESIRKAGATGLHLSRGERSTLDAFQSAAKQIGSAEVGALAPFYAFYPAVEGFLDTAVKKTIEQAGDNHALEEFDSTILKVLFLIRYVEEVPGNVDNLVTLCVDEIDADRLALRKVIEASLARLEGETLIARNGDLYYFLTNEERDISREIKNTTIQPGSEERELGKLIFQDILGDVRKHNYSKTGRDFSFTRQCDDQLVGQRLEGSLEVMVVSPLGDRYGHFRDDGSCLMHTSTDSGCVLVRLPDEASLGRELREYIQTEDYVRTKHTSTLPDTTKKILRDRSEDNRARRKRIATAVKAMLEEAAYFTASKKLTIDRSDPKDAVGDALEYLIENAYPKMGYVKHLHPDPKREIQSTLRANDVEQVGLKLEAQEGNLEALNDLREYVRLCSTTNKEVVLHDLINKRYGDRPYGWPELEVALLVARLAVLKEIDLIVNKAVLPLEQAYDYLVSSSKQRKVVLVKRVSADDQIIKDAQALGKSLFAEQGPDTEDALFSFLKAKLTTWHRELTGFETLAATGNYPGLTELRDCLATLHKFVEESDSVRFLSRFVECKQELKEMAESFHDLHEFYTNQKHTWEKLRAAVAELALNRMQLEADEDARPALSRMEEILKAAKPYGMLHEVEQLAHRARTVNGRLVQEACSKALTEINKMVAAVTQELDKVSADEKLRQEAMIELVKLTEAAQSAKSIAHIAQARDATSAACDRAFAVIEEAQKKSDPGSPQPKKRTVIDARSFVGKGFIETPDDIEGFLKALRDALQAAVRNNERIQIK